MQQAMTTVLHPARPIGAATRARRQERARAALFPIAATILFGTVILRKWVSASDAVAAATLVSEALLAVLIGCLFLRGRRARPTWMAGALPGLVLGYFLVPGAATTGAAPMASQMLIFIGTSVALYLLLYAALRPIRQALPAAFGMLAFSFYFWHAAPTIVASLNSLGPGLDLDASLAVAIRTAALGLGFLWLQRVLWTEIRFPDDTTVTARERPGPCNGPCRADPRASRRIVIVGAGIAGATAAASARRQASEACITVIGDETRMTYNRTAITALLHGDDAAEGLQLYAPDWFERQGIRLRLGNRVIAIDRAARRVRLRSGESVPYDKLILATGAGAWVPDLPGFQGPGAFVVRAARDVRSIRRYIERNMPRRAVVVGAGLLGIEAARELARIGLDVTLLSNRARPLDRQSDSASAQILLTHLRELGIAFEPLAEAGRILRCDAGTIRGLRLRDGRTRHCELVLVCAGIAPATELAREAGLAVGRGVRVDSRMCTADPDIFAAGDVAERDGRCPGLWSVAQEQAEVAASNALGGNLEYRPVPGLTVLKTEDLDYRAIGVLTACEGDEEVIDDGRGASRYRKLILRGNVPVGALLVGHPACAELIVQWIRSAEPLSAARVAALRAGHWPGPATAREDAGPDFSGGREPPYRSLAISCRQ